MIPINFASSKNNDEDRVMQSQSNIEIIINHKADEVIE